MKKFTFFLLFGFIIVLASCDKSISPETSKAFIGEYWMETSSVYMIGEIVDHERTYTIWSPVEIYEENGILLVETNWFGAPYKGGERKAPYIVEEYRERPAFVTPRRVLMGGEDSDDDGSEIEDVVVTGDPITFLRDGFIYTIKNGIYVKSEPIVVKSGSSTVLHLEEFIPVEVTITNMEGTDFGKITVKNEYGPMLKSGDVITWQVDLDLSKMSEIDPSMRVDHVVHKNTLYKR